MQKAPGIFGIPLRQSIQYANVAISLEENGQSYIYGYVPIVVAKCGVFLKEKGVFPTIHSVLIWLIGISNWRRRNFPSKRLGEAHQRAQDRI